jgi:RND superfamily putative drug exporter
MFQRPLRRDTKGNLLMSRRPSTAGLARSSARHPWRVISVWVVILVLATIVGSGLGDVLTTDEEFTNRPESVRAADLLESRLRGPEPVTETIIVRSDTATVDDPAFQAVVEQVRSDLVALPDIVASVVTYDQALRDDPAAAATLVSADRHTGLIAVTLVGDHEDTEAYAERYLDTVARHGAHGFTVLTAGDLSSSHEFSSIAASDLQKAEVLGMPVALLVLIVVFGALVAAGVPLILSMVAIVVALGLTTLVGQFVGLSFYVINIITMIGLAVGIDYALFILARYREERLQGLDTLDAITAAGASASKAVLFSGITVVLALSGMLLLPSTIFRSLGAGAVLVVLAAVAAALTLAPALIGLLGDRIDTPAWRLSWRMFTWPARQLRHASIPGKLAAVPVGLLVILPAMPLMLLLAAVEIVVLNILVGGPARLVRRVAGRRRGASVASDSGFWPRVSRVVMARPLISALAAIVLLIAMALPYFELKTGFAGVESLPESDTRTALEALKRDFYVGRLAPVQVVVDGPLNEPEVQAGIDQVVAAIRQDPQFGPATITPNRIGDLALIEAPLKSDTNAPESYAAVDWLRDDIVPRAFRQAPAVTYVGGATAENADFNQAFEDWTLPIFAFVLGLSFLVLLVAFRSLVVPIKALVMNLLSVGAAYGLLVLVFQKGYGADLFGFQQTPTIEAWLPIFLFCVLFGLSMDYHIFLLSRIREHYDQTHDNRASVAVGLQSTGKLITGAALIMMVVFAGFAAGKLVMFQQMGFGLAVAIFLDATLVRSVLVPASMALLGNRNWYLPRWLGWLPGLRIEGPRLAGPIEVPVVSSAGND